MNGTVITHKHRKVPAPVSSMSPSPSPSANTTACRLPEPTAANIDTDYMEKTFWSNTEVDTENKIAITTCTTCRHKKKVPRPHRRISADKLVKYVQVYKKRLDILKSKLHTYNDRYLKYTQEQSFREMFNQHEGDAKPEE